jgi:predicted phage terminase large subunit-like protein
MRPEGDKITRLCVNQAYFESGSAHFPQRAPWSDDLIAELLAFPHGRHDDQVDLRAQALTWISQKQRKFEHRDYANHRQSAESVT